MTTVPPAVFRAARRIHEQLSQARSSPPAVELPQGSWEQCRRLTRLIQFAHHRRWSTAVLALQARLAGALTDLRALLDECRPPVPPGPFECDLSLRQIQEELLALFAEFDYVTIDLRGHTLSVTTPPIVLEDIPLGRFDIRLDWRRLDRHQPYEVVALDPCPAAGDSETTHPHVQNDHLCEGEGRVAIREALRQGRLSDFFLIVTRILNTHNPGSAYVPLDHWNGRPCSDCGESVSEEAEYDCADCGRLLCQGCSERCTTCEECFCTECLLTCGCCHSSVCRSCRATCDGCQEDSCQGCLDRGRCPNCREADMPDEIAHDRPDVDAAGDATAAPVQVDPQTQALSPA